MLDPKQIAAALAADLPDMLALTERVVNLDSGTYHAAGVNAVIDIWADYLRDAGFEVNCRRLRDRGDQLTARRRFGEGRRVLILGHADTVWPAGTVAGWRFRRDGDWISGPGVGDMKSCVVMGLHALRQIVRDPPPGLGAITMLIVPDEEIGSPGSRGWIEAEARQADACLTLEPCRPGGGIVIGRGAVGAVYVRASGITAHVGSARAAGASAIAALAPMIPAVEALTASKPGIGASVGLFRGGEARQVVPAEAEFHLDLRAADQEGAEWLLARITKIVETPPADTRVDVRWEGGFYRPPFPTGAGTRALFSVARELGNEIGTPVQEVISAGGSDGSFAAALGVPGLDGLGPICHDTCSRRERVEIGSIVPRGALFAALLGAVGRGLDATTGTSR